MKRMDAVAAAPLQYDPNRFVDQLLARLKAKNDAALCRQLCSSPPLISKIRHQRLLIGASLLIRAHEVSGMANAELRTLMGNRRSKYRISEGGGRAA